MLLADSANVWHHEPLNERQICESPVCGYSLPKGHHVMDRVQLAKAIDHSLLRPAMTEAELITECETAVRFGVASVCAKPHQVPLVARLLAGSQVRLGVAVSFPHGGSTSAIKAIEADSAVSLGAVELDMVMNVDALLSGDLKYVENDIGAVVKAAPDAIVKVIIETAYLNQLQKVAACRAAEEAGAHFVKTSTGFAPTGATVEDVVLMKSSVGSHMQVKAAGGIRSLSFFLELLDAGASRIGATATASLLIEWESRDNGQS